MTLTYDTDFQPHRATVMTHTYAKYQGQRSPGSEAREETDGQTDGHDRSHYLGATADNSNGPPKETCGCRYLASYRGSTKTGQPRSGPQWIGAGSESVPRSVRTLVTS